MSTCFCEQNPPLFLIVFCAYDSANPTHTYTESHTQTPRSTVRGCLGVIQAEQAFGVNAFSSSSNSAITFSRSRCRAFYCKARCHRPSAIAASVILPLLFDGKPTQAAIDERKQHSALPKARYPARTTESHGAVHGGTKGVQGSSHPNPIPPESLFINVKNRASIPYDRISQCKMKGTLRSKPKESTWIF